LTSVLTTAEAGGKPAMPASSARSKKAMTRRSYSVWRAVRPPVWSASGISHSSLGSPAAA
jgi:hypothetical protein